MECPQDLKYTKEHEWIRMDGQTGTMGITAHAANELGDITFIELPKKDQDVQQHDTISSIESVKAASDIYAPAGGTICAVNPHLDNAPELINESPYDKGWICRITVKHPGDLDRLMTSEQYDSYLKEHAS